MVPDVLEAVFGGGKVMLSSIMFHELLLVYDSVSMFVQWGLYISQENMGAIKLMTPAPHSPPIQSQALLYF